MQAESKPALLGEPSRSPEHSDGGAHQVSVIWVMDSAGFGADLGL